MYLTQLDIRRVRNLQPMRINPVFGLNLIDGPNASGKTSLLEAIHILSTGRSFRTPKIQNLIQYHTNSLQVVGKVRHDETSPSLNLGIERSVKESRIRINQTTVQQTSRLAFYLPVQIITPEAHQLLEQGPSHRRKFLDWGVFHVEQSFHAIWQQYNRILKQRNAALRSGGPAKSIQLWDQSLLETGNQLTEFRQAYLNRLLPYINDAVQSLLGLVVEIQYLPGWPQTEDFEKSLVSGLGQDQNQGYTRYGPHRAELKISSNQLLVKEQFSRGQQKLLVCALRLAQIEHLRQEAKQTCVVMVDDLAAELDSERRQRLLQRLMQTKAQTFITLTERELVNPDQWDAYKLFHVEHGNVTEVV